MAEYRILVPPPQQHRRVWVVVVALVALVVVVAGVIVFSHHRHGSAHATGSGGASPTTATAPALAVVSSVPANGATDVPSDQAVTVHLSAALTADGGSPTFSPPVSGSWHKVGADALSFAASAPFIPTTVETLVVPAGSAGPHGVDGQRLATPTTITFTVAQASTERLQQLLAQLNYLPLSFTPTGATEAAQATTVQPGTFAWRWSGLPAQLTSQWTEGYEDVITKGAVMNFENQNGLTVDGIAGKSVWSALIADVGTHKVNTNPYTYVLVSKQLPENLTLYVNGAPTMANTPVNTGAPGADTVDGTYPVFEHVTSSRMVGTNPDGSTYDDPDVPWASFFNGGDALHGFVRATYGSPQSNGCVEMSIADAAQVWPLTPIGTLVTVEGPAS